MKKCPTCAITVHEEAIQCAECGKDLRGVEDSDDLTSDEPDESKLESTSDESKSKGGHSPEHDKCGICGGLNGVGREFCQSCGNKMEAPQRVIANGAERESRLITKDKVMGGRYTDAYYIADATVAWGSTAKTLGVIVGILIAAFGLFMSDRFGIGAIFPFLISAVSVWCTFYMFGVLIAALGQMLRAILDTAINTSPLLSTDQKSRLIIGTDAGADAYTGP